MQRKLVEIIRSKLHQITLKFYLHSDERNYTFSWSPIRPFKDLRQLVTCQNQLLISIFFSIRNTTDLFRIQYIYVFKCKISVLLKSISSFSKNFNKIVQFLAPPMITQYKTNCFILFYHLKVFKREHITQYKTVCFILCNHWVSPQAQANQMM